MAILLADSFDLYGATAEMGNRWGNQDPTTVTLDPTGGRFGGGAVKMASTSGLTGPSGVNQVLIATSLYCDANEAGSIIQFDAGDSGFNELVVSSTGQLELLAAEETPVTLNAVLNPGKWYRVELYAFNDDDNSIVRVWVNGVKLFDQQPWVVATYYAGISNVRIKGTGAVNWWHDDIVIKDDDVPLGDLRIDALTPDGAGAASQWTPNGDTANHLTTDDPVPGGSDGDTTYNATTVLGNKDRFSFSDLPSETNTILAVQVAIEARSEGANSIALLAESGGTENAGPTVSVPTGYSLIESIFENNPTTASAWTESEVNAAEFGYRLDG